jgi:hypothetical protein
MADLHFRDTFLCGGLILKQSPMYTALKIIIVSHTTGDVASLLNCKMKAITLLWIANYSILA